MALTKREKIALAVLALLIPIIYFIPQNAIKEYEPLFLMIVLVPLGLLLATDSERKAK